jgi:hypothetical protein
MLHIKLDNITCFPLHEVEAKTTMALQWEAPSQNKVLDVFNYELTTHTHFILPNYYNGITYPFILASLYIGLGVDYPPFLILVHNEFPQNLCFT